MSLRELYNPIVTGLHIEPSAGGRESKIIVDIKVQPVDKAGMKTVQEAVFRALRLSVFLNGSEVPPGGGGGTGHEGGYVDGFKAGITVKELSPDHDIQGQVVVLLVEDTQPGADNNEEQLGAFDFVRLRTPAVAYPSLAWPAEGLEMTVLSGDHCGTIPPYITVAILPNSPLPEGEGYRQVGRAYCIDVPDPKEHRPIVLRLPVPGVLSDAERKQLAAYVFMSELAIVPGVLCQQQDDTTSLSILTRRLSKATVTLAIKNS